MIYNNNAIEQTTHYYPFGLLFGENTKDYGARHYDPVLARFTTMDPMAEKYYDNEFSGIRGDDKSLLNNKERSLQSKKNDIGNDMPSDPNDPSSLNGNLSIMEKNPISSNDIIRMLNKIIWQLYE